MARVGLAVWTSIGMVVLLVVLIAIFGTISEIAIPVLLGAVVAVVLKPAADAMMRRGLGASAAAGIVLAGLLVVVIGVGAAVAAGLVERRVSFREVDSHG